MTDDTKDEGTYHYLPQAIAAQPVTVGETDLPGIKLDFTQTDGIITIPLLVEALPEIIGTIITAAVVGFAPADRIEAATALFSQILDEISRIE